MDYHDRIMNLKLEKYWGFPVEDDFSYKMGHRDARYSAAEIAIEADKKIKELKSEIEGYAKQLDKANMAMSKWPPAMGQNGRMNVGKLVEMLIAEIEYKDEMLNVSMTFSPPLYECGKCGALYADGYCCPECGDGSPGEPLSEEE
jgi:hypothetical protein